MIKLLLIKLSFLTLFSFAFGIPTDNRIRKQNAIIFDAGSKNTRMTVYSFTSSNNIENLEIERIEFCELKDGGLSNYIHEAEVKSKFTSCMDTANAIIPISERSKTKIYLAATAGMRLLEVRNKGQSDLILQYVRNYFKNSGYLFETNDQVRIISGQEEGNFAWLSTNFLSKTIGNNKRKTYGILELGGSSGQITFLPNPSIQTENSLTNKFFNNYKFNQIDYNIYSHSFLCFGTTQIANLYNSFKLKSEQYSKSFKASCYPDGASEELTGEDLINEACVNGDMFNGPSYTFTIDKSRLNREDQIVIKGNSKKNKCREEVDIIIPTPPCMYSRCSFNGVYSPSVESIEFFALGNFVESIENTEKLLNIVIQNDLQKFDEATYKICEMSFTQLKDMSKDNNAGISKKKLRKLCLENVYILKLLKLYGFSSMRNINSVEIVNNQTIHWSQGFLINEVFKIHQTSNNTDTNIFSFLSKFWNFIIALFDF